MVLDEGAVATGTDWALPMPIWVMDVVTPYTGRWDIEKPPIYKRNGIREAWLLHPGSEQVVVHDFAADSVTKYNRPEHVPSSAVPGFVLDLEEFFRVGA